MTVLVVGVHIALAASMSGPTITDDELGFLANARVLAGEDSTPLQYNFSPTKYAGYSLLLVPLHWAGLSPLGVFHGALVVNALLGGLVLLAGYGLARQVWRAERGPALGIATAVSLYPAVLLNASFAWSETLLFSLVLLVALCAYRLVARPGLANAVAFSALAGGLYFSHPRLGGVTALCGVFVIALALRRRLAPSLLAVCLGLIALLTIITREVHGWLLPQIYGDDGAAFADDRAGVYLDVLTTPSQLKDTVLGAAGTGWYLGVASLGLAWVGFGALAWIAAGKDAGGRSAALRWHSGFVCAGLLVLLATSALSLSGAGDRVDYRFYGRYVETFGPLLLISSLCFLHTRATRSRALLAALAAGGATTVALGLVMYFGNGAERFRDVPAQGVTILGALAQAGAAFPLAEGFPVWRATVVSTFALCIVAAIAVRSRTAAAVLLCVLFLGSAAATHDRYVAPLSEAIQQTTVLHRSTALVGAHGISYDITAHADTGALTLPLNQFNLPGIQFRLFDSESGESPSDEFVIARATWPDAKARGARPVARETFGAQTLWVLPGETADALARSGALLPEVGTTVGPGAMRSSVSLQDTPTRAVEFCAGSAWRLSATLRHAGQGAAWPQTTFGDAGPIPGRVYLVHEWRDAESDVPVTPQRWAGDLPWTLAPGESARVQFTAEASDGDAAPLRPGHYTLRLGLHQDGVGSFWEVGPDRPLDVMVTVRECESTEGSPVGG